MSIAADAGTQMPAGTALGLGALMIVSGGLLVGVGWAAATGRLRRNWFAGIRTTASMSSDEAWGVPSGRRTADGSRGRGERGVRAAPVAAAEQRCGPHVRGRRPRGRVGDDDLVGTGGQPCREGRHLGRRDGGTAG
ncbi:MAG: SdpI family protein [Ilumatobacteraceae bacterium]